MATNAPCTRCIVCGEHHEYEVEQVHREPWEPFVFGPTPWKMKSHTCPPGAIEKFREEFGIIPEVKP